MKKKPASIGSSLSIEIGMDCISNAAIELNTNPDHHNLLDVTGKALRDNSESSAEIILASLTLHDDVRHNKNLRDYIESLGNAL